MRTDLRYAVRTLLKRPGFTLLTVLTIALGVAATATIFSIVNAYYLRPLPFRQPDRLVYITDVQPGKTLTPASFPEFEEYRTATQLFEGVTAGYSPSMNLTGRERPQRLRVGMVARGYFSVFGVQPIAGRGFTAEEHRAGAQPVVLLSSAFWRTEFGAAPGVVGSALTLDGTRYTVAGILDGERLNFGAGASVHAWIPLERNLPFSTPGTHYLSVFARLRPGTSVEQARSGLAVHAKRIDEKYKSGHGIAVTPLRDRLFGKAKASLVMLLAAACFLMLIASGNVANLLLARATARGREFAIRLAIGASRWHLVRQTLSESICIVFAGSIIGLTLSVWAARALPRLWPAGLIRPQDFHLDWRVLLFHIGISAATAILCGLGPAFRFSAGSLSERLRDGWGHFAGGRNRSRGALVAGQIAVACVLLSGASLLLTSFWRVLKVDPGFHPENVLTMRVSLPPAKFQDDWQRIAFFDKVMDRLRALPGATAVGAGNSIPLDGNGMDGNFVIEGRPRFPRDQEPAAEKHIVTPDYFRALGVRLLRGRWFTDRDNGEGGPVVIINQAMARKFWPNENPIGKRMDLQFGRRAPQEIVGVVSDLKLDSLDLPARYEGYLPFRQEALTSMTIVIRTTADPAALAAAARNQVFAIDPEEPVADVITMEQVVDRSLSGRRLSALIVAAFATLALLLASVGIYGVISYWVSQRIREIGIRSALGAKKRDIFELVIGRGMLLAGWGAGLGLVTSFLLTRYMESLLFGISAHHWLTLTAVPLVLATVAFLACAIPAARAAKVDPLVALRFD